LRKVNKYVIIVAGGKGNRFKSELPKQFFQLGDKPILMHTIKAFFKYEPRLEIIVVLPSDQIDFWKELCLKYKFNITHKVVAGGKARFHSVKNGLALIDKNGIVGIHDGVRPLIDKQTIKNCYLIAEQRGNAIPVVDLVDSVRKVNENGSNKMVDRSKYKLIQTPQVFKNELILAAYSQEYRNSFTDDASVLEAYDNSIINLVEGNRQNIKITTPEDLIYAEATLKSRN
jgi:2-C-methyl-D-erythritol 4-phosphate cytidylyltransferase